MNFSANSSFWFLLAAVSVAAPLAAFALSGKAIEGRVVEAVSSKPLPQVVVLVLWQGSVPAFAESRQVCIHADSTVTDSNGNFRFQSWRKSSDVGPLVLDVGPVITVHKAGYYQKEWLPDTSTVRLVPFIGTREERLAYLSRMAMSCSDRKEIEFNLLPFYKSLHEEAKGLAVTKDDKLKVLYRLRDIERLEIGTDKAWENFRERERELK